MPNLAAIRPYLAAAGLQIAERGDTLSRNKAVRRSDGNSHMAARRPEE
jgi:hypothetical protein